MHQGHDEDDDDEDDYDGYDGDNDVGGFDLTSRNS